MKNESTSIHVQSVHFKPIAWVSMQKRNIVLQKSKGFINTVNTYHANLDKGNSRTVENNFAPLPWKPYCGIETPEGFGPSNSCILSKLVDIMWHVLGKVSSLKAQFSYLSQRVIAATLARHERERSLSWCEARMGTTKWQKTFRGQSNNDLVCATWHSSIMTVMYIN